MRVPATALALLLGLSSLASAQTLDYEFYKKRVEPIFLARRAGHARCVACHAGGTPLRLEPLTPGMATWTEDQSRKNFAAVSRVVVPGSAQSRLLVHPLAEQAGGDFLIAIDAAAGDDRAEALVPLRIVS